MWCWTLRLILIHQSCHFLLRYPPQRYHQRSYICQSVFMHHLQKMRQRWRRKLDELPVRLRRQRDRISNEIQAPHLLQTIPIRTLPSLAGAVDVLSVDILFFFFLLYVHLQTSCSALFLTFFVPFHHRSCSNVHTFTWTIPCIRAPRSPLSFTRLTMLES